MAVILTSTLPTSHLKSPTRANAQCIDPRFRFLNYDYFADNLVLIAHMGPPFSNGFGGLSDAGASRVFWPRLHAMPRCRRRLHIVPAFDQTQHHGRFQIDALYRIHCVVFRATNTCFAAPPPFFSCYGRVVDLCDLVLSVLASMFAGKPVPTSHADLPWFTVTRWQDDPFACGSYSFMQVGLASGLVLPPSLLTRGLP